MSPHKEIIALNLDDCDCTTLLCWLHANERYYNRPNQYGSAYKMYCDVLVYLTDHYDSEVIDHCTNLLQPVWRR
jgi:hypothetical protein